MYSTKSLLKDIKDKIIFKGKFNSKINKKKYCEDTLKILRKYKLIKNFYKFHKKIVLFSLD